MSTARQGLTALALFGALLLYEACAAVPQFSRGVTTEWRERIPPSYATCEPLGWENQRDMVLYCRGKLVRLRPDHRGELR